MPQQKPITITSADLEDESVPVISSADLEQGGEQAKEEKPKGHGASGKWESPTSQKIKDSILSYLPSWHTAAVAGGAIAGTAAGGVGAIPGAAIGESVYQIGQHLTGSPEAPKTPEEAIKRNAEAVAGATVAEAIPALAKYHGQHPLWPGIQKAYDSMFTPSQTLMTRGLNPADRMFQNHVEAGLDELKAAEKQLGQTIKTVPEAQSALKIRTKVNNITVKGLVKPQETVVYPGSGKIMQDAQIDNIPEDIRLNNPAKYSKMVQDIRDSHPHDFTLGELNTLRSELGATQSSYYGKDLSGQLTMDAGTRAIDIARGSTSRRLLYHGMDNYGYGGGTAAAEANRRIGSIIHYQDALQDSLNKAVAERVPISGKIYKTTGSILSPGTSLKEAAKGTNRTTEKNLALAIKRWKGLPSPINTQMGQRVTGMVGQQQTLLPMNTAVNPYASGQQDMLTPPAVSSQGIGESGFRAQQIAGQANRAAPPPTVEGVQQPLNTFPGPLGSENYVTKGTYLSPEEEYLELMRQREIWDKGLPNSKRTIPSPTQGQQPLFQGIGKRPDLFGVNQTSDVAGKTVEPGTTLAFKSKTLDGREVWHYERPDGTMFEADQELSPAAIKPRINRPYEEGSSWGGNPYGSGPTPPPKRTSKRISKK